MCVLDYDFAILDNAFLVHRPGIKTKGDNFVSTNAWKVSAQKDLMKNTISAELKLLYGQPRPECHL